MIGEILVGVVPFLREQAESVMLDTCTVHRAGALVTDPTTGTVTPTLTLIYTGKCKVQQTLAQSSNPVAGGHAFTVQESRVDFPVTAGPFQVNDVVTMTSSALDAQLVGRKFRVTDLFHESIATAQRIRVEEVPA